MGRGYFRFHGVFIALFCLLMLANSQAFGQSVFISETGSHAVLQYLVDGTFIRSLVIQGNPYDITFGADGYLYVVNNPGRRLEKWDPNTGTFLGSVGDLSPYSLPLYITLGPDNALYLTTQAQEIVKVDPATGVTTLVFSNSNSDSDLVFTPHTGTPADTLLDNEGVNQLDVARNVLHTTRVVFATGFSGIGHMAVGPDDRIYGIVGGSIAPQIKVVGKTGGAGTAFTAINPACPFCALQGLAFESNGNLWAGGGSVGSSGVIEFDPSGNIIKTLPLNPLTDQRLSNTPTGIAVGGCSGVIGHAGFSQANPVLPTTASTGFFQFSKGPCGFWFDPPVTTAGYDYHVTGGSSFTRIMDFPAGFGPLTVSSPGCTIPGSFTAGMSVDFVSLCGGQGVTDFSVTGLNPRVDQDSTTGFPLKIAFNTTAADFTMTARKTDQTITVTQHAPATAVYGSSFGVAATASSSRVVTIESGGTACSGFGSSGATLTMTSGTGICVVSYYQNGDASYNPAPTISEVVTATKRSQTITFTGAPATAAHQSTFNVTATASSGLPVTLGASGVCTISGTTVTMTDGNGTCALTANQSGDDNYAAAPQATQSTTAIFAPGPTTLSATVSNKTGPFGGTRVWTITVTNAGTGGANNVQIKSLVLTQTSGTACTPIISPTTAQAVIPGNLAPSGGHGDASYTINFAGCGNSAYFKATAQLSANGDMVTGSMVLLNQFQ